MTTGARIAAAALLAAALASGGCPGRSGTGSARADAGVVVVASPVADAEVWVNGRYIGRVADLQSGIALSPGLHRIELRHDAYHTRYVEVEVEQRQRQRLELELAEALP